MSMAFDAAMRKLMDDVMAGYVPKADVTDRVIVRGANIVFLEDGDTYLSVHHSSKCQGRTCVIHNPTDHPMRNLPLNYRADRNIFERICTHGIGHPDPDQRDFFYEQGFQSSEVCDHGDLIEDCRDGCGPSETTREQRAQEHRDAQMVHGCDGCCGV